MRWGSLKKTVFCLCLSGAMAFGPAMSLQAQTTIKDYYYDDDDYYYYDDNNYYYDDSNYNYDDNDSYDNDYNNNYDDDYDDDYDSEVYDTPQETYELSSQAVAKGTEISFSIVPETKYNSSTGSYVSANITWAVDDNSVAKISETSADGTQVKVKGVKEGSTTLRVTYTYQMTKGQIIYTSAATVDVTNPKLASKSVGINLYNSYGYGEASIELTGLAENSTITCTTSSKKLSAEGYTTSYNGEGTGALYFECSKKGDYTVTVVIDGKTFECKVTVFKAYFKRNSKSIDYEMDKTWHEGDTMLILYKGESTKLTVKGLNKSTKINWSSSDKTIAKVSSDGTVRAKGSGYCTITATFGGSTISYEVGVSAKKAVLAIRYAVKHYNSTYSQPLRMSTGYYDCSSYVWRAYQSAKSYLGSSSYAPTAADLAKWCKEKGYVIYDGKANINKLLPGDLIFETGENNGRYKGIYHVDLYVGNNITLTVARSKIWYGTVTDVVVARPCKAK